MRCANRVKLFSFLLIVVLLALLIVGCVPEKRFRVLSFFFDGVPDPNKKTELITSTTSVDSSLTVKREFKPEYYVHKPYEENKCSVCHEEGFSNALRKTMPELCYTCHEDFNTKYKVLHGPVASGYCINCHNQHMAKFEKLLEQPGQQLCMYCHESGQVLKGKMHEHIEDKNCTECHSPHGGDNRGMLKPGSCYTCHENFASKYNFLHGPVASGNCTACHDSHSSWSPKLLLQQSQQLCLFCHNAEQVAKNSAHKKIKKNNCTECHNPHGGDNRAILLPALMPGKGQRPTVKPNMNTNADSLSKIRILNNPENDSALTKPIHQR